MAHLHLICRRELNLSKRDKDRWVSGKWDMKPDEASRLIGGTLYLHETKAELSYFGGEVIAVEEVLADDVKKPERIQFVFKPTMAAKNIKWRGQDHARAWCSGIIE